jgi:hypothetical protein
MKTNVFNLGNFKWILQAQYYASRVQATNVKVHQIGAPEQQKRWTARD